MSLSVLQANVLLNFISLCWLHYKFILIASADYIIIISSYVTQITS